MTILFNQLQRWLWYNGYNDLKTLCNKIGLQMAEISMLNDVKNMASYYFWRVSASKSQPFEVQFDQIRLSEVPVLRPGFLVRK